MYFKYIDRHTIEIAPCPINYNGGSYTNGTEEFYNNLGYYKVINKDYPDDGKKYKIYYIPPTNLQNYITQNWELVDTPLSEFLEEN